MFRKLSVIAALLLVSGGAAFAADLPTAKPAPPPIYVPPVFSWTGFYLGVNAGAAWNNGGSVNIFDPTVPSNNRFGIGSNVGFIGGGQAGYNFQTGAFVWGLETDIQGIAGGGSSINFGPYTFLNLKNGDGGGWLGTTRGRLGYAIDRTLLYVTGGVAYGGFNNGPFNNSETDVGYAVGGGVEYAFAQHWTAKVEALYVNLGAGSRTINATSGGVVYPITVRSGDGGGGIARVGINYLF
jgi:outer membrane immunogenic protein